MKYIFKYCLFFILCYCITFPIKSQSLEDLNSTKRKIENQIQQLNVLINENANLKSETINNLNLVSQRIKLKNSLINQLELEILYLNNNILQSQSNIDSLSFLLNSRKKELEKILQFYQKYHNSYNILIFILSSNSFNQSFLRIKFYNSIIKYYSNTIKSISTDINKISEIKVSLENQKKELYLKQLQKIDEIKTLRKDLDLYNSKLKKLKSNEKNLRKQIEIEKRRSNEIISKINELIEEETRKKIISTNKSNENVKLSNDFLKNYGKLPHPVANAFVINNFGETNHPVLKGVKIKNNGVDFACKTGSEIRSIFNGEVKKVFNLPMNGIAVIIRHGNYLSVYSNLTSVYVKVGDKVITEQVIGKIVSNDNSGSILHFEIWNEKNPENPLMWIY